jgi:hypothetical protein
MICVKPYPQERRSVGYVAKKSTLRSSGWSIAEISDLCMKKTENME